MKRKKILFVHHAGAFGGAPKSMSYIIKNLNTEFFSPVLLNIAEGPINNFFKKELPCDLIVDDQWVRPFHGSYVVEWTFILFLRNWLFLIPSILKACFLLKKIKPDLVHLNSTCLFAFSIAAKILKIPTVCHVREPIRNGMAGWPLRFFNKITVKGFIAISQFDLDSLGPIPPRVFRTVIHNFVDKFHGEVNPKGRLMRDEIGAREGDVVFLYLARFAESNGWRKLIEMGKKAVRESNRIHFVLIGASKDEHYHYVDDRIHILPFSTETDKFFLSADVFVCPFVLPHFARGIIEASSYALPTIGNDIGGVNELVEDGKTGFLYATESEFIDCCLKLATDIELRRELGKNAFNSAIKRFNIEYNLKETYNFYEKVGQV